MPITLLRTDNASYRNRVLEDGAILYWPIDEQSGSVVRDLSPRQVNGTRTWAPLATSGPLSDGTNAELFWTDRATKITGSDTGLPASNAQRSIELWYRTDDTAGYLQMLALYGVLGVGGQCCAFYLSSFNLVFSLWGGDTTIAASTSRAIWHHAVVTTTGTTGWLSYFDGAAGAPVSSNPATVLAGATGVTIGNWNTFPDYLLMGSVAHFAVYPTILTPGQVAEHYRLARVTPYVRRSRMFMTSFAPAAVEKSYIMIDGLGGLG